MSINSGDPGYYIYSVQYDESHKEIESVRLKYPGTLQEVGGAGCSIPKEKVIHDIESGKVLFETYPPIKNGFQPVGNDVHVVYSENGSKYLRAEGNHIEEDYLGELLEY